MFIALPPHDHCVYQLMSRTGHVLYVGSSSGLFSRLGQHAKTKDWWSQVAAIEVEAFATKDEMLDREQVLIELIDPPYNDTYGTVAALVTATDILGRPITRADVRAFIKNELIKPSDPITPSPEPSSEPPTPLGIGLREYVELYHPEIELATLIRWRERRSDFPEPVASGERGVKLYDRADLDLFVLARVG